MPNTHVFTGMDGAISVAVERRRRGRRRQGRRRPVRPDADRARDRRHRRGRSEMRPFHELGQRYATELRPGNVNVCGHDRPRARQRRAAEADARRGRGDEPAGGRPSSSPTFNLSLRMENAGLPGNSSTITVHGVKLDGWS